MEINIVNVISAMLAPGIMISACGLLILGMNNKYSIVVNRIRLLNEERRKVAQRATERDFTNEENLRLHSINKQLELLVFRVKLVRNAVISYTSAVALFVFTSLLIGTTFFTKVELLNYPAIIIFLAGMISVFIGVSYAGYESKRGYEIITFEVNVDE